MQFRRPAVICACFALFWSLPACGGGSAEETDSNTDNSKADSGHDTGGSDDTGVDTAPPDPCASVKCTANSTCKVADGKASCSCDDGYVPWKDGCSRDADKDGLSEDEELEVAKELAPVLLFDPDEKLSARRSYFAVMPTPGGGRSVYYAHSYFNDGGSVFGVSKHLGDSEYVVVTRNPAGEITLFLSAHYQASTDASGWYPLSKFEKKTMDGRSRPVVWVALRKHGNYVDDATCEVGAYHLDTCGRGTYEMPQVLPDRNVGQSAAPIIDDVEVDGNHEWYWTDAPFCGWQIAGGPTADRSGCTPPQNGYGRQLRAWESGTL